MFISEYIIYGGKDLNSPAKKTVNFPEMAEKVFWQIQTDLSDNSREFARYIEVPIDTNARMLIKSFWDLGEGGSRPVYYSVGFLVPKQLYVDCKEYYIVNQALNNISLPKILSSFENKQPIDFSCNEIAMLS